MLAHGHDLGNDRSLGPVDAEYFCELPQVLCSGLSDGENGVTKPPHAQVTKLFVEEFDAQLAGKKRNILNNGQANSPLLILGQLDNGWEKGLGEELNSDNCRGSD